MKRKGAGISCCLILAAMMLVVVVACGSVEVTERFTIKRYNHVMHTASNVEGRLWQGMRRVDALLVVLPAGTVSGVSKIRTMQITDGFENGDFSGRKTDIQAGGGIVLNMVWPC